MTQLVIDGPNNRVAAYSGAQDSAVENNPLANLARIHYHSDLDYLGFEKVSTTQLVALSGFSDYQRSSYTVHTHSRGYIPVFFAVVNNWGPNPIPIGGGTLLDYFGRKPTAGEVVENTEIQVAWGSTSSALIAGATIDSSAVKFWVQKIGTYSNFTFNLDIYIGDRSINSSSGDSAPASVFDAEGDDLEITGTRIAPSGNTGNVFSGEKHYPAVPGTGGQTIPLFTGPAVNLEFSTTANSANFWSRLGLNYGNGWAYRMVLQERIQNVNAPANPGGTTNAKF